MTPLATLRDIDIFPNKEVSFVDEWVHRKTVKVIIMNADEKIALVTNPIHQCFLLPGGGVDDGEEVFVAADRESQEEAGCKFRSIRQIGTIVEFRSRDKKQYETYGVIAEAGDPITNDLRTEEERKNQLSVVWVSREDAENKFIAQEILVREGKIDFYNSAFNIVRDHLYFREAIKQGLI